jgi:hypothetical protein
MINADRAGSNGAPVRLWQLALQRFAEHTGLTGKTLYFMWPSKRQLGPHQAVDPMLAKGHYGKRRSRLARTAAAAGGYGLDSLFR